MHYSTQLKEGITYSEHLPDASIFYRRRGTRITIATYFDDPKRQSGITSYSLQQFDEWADRINIALDAASGY